VPKYLTVVVAAKAKKTAMGATIVKVYEWRQNVLYGPYLAKERAQNSGDRLWRARRRTVRIPF